MKVYFASDHAGFELKNELLAYVRDELGYQVEDCGATEFDSEDDYNDFIKPAAEAVAADPDNTRAIILGGSGQGEAMQANRYRKVRAAVYYGGEEKIVRLSREHNDANIISLGARFIGAEGAKQAVKLWLSTPALSGPKYHRRINKMD